MIDVQRVTFMNSMGPGACIAIRNPAEANKAPTILYGLAAELFQMLKVVKVDHLFALVQDEAELKRALPSA